jgi:ribosomal protein S18 acetylase RimI-like enzyme
MRVTAAHRRSGIAQRLLDVAEAFCRQQGYRRIVLDTTERQDAAMRLYEKNGYVLLDERLRGGFMAFLYEKELE